jgi:hypothetical protein
MMGFFSICHRVQFGSGAHPASFQWVPGALTPRVEREGREADHSPPSSADVKNAWSYTSTPPVGFHGAGTILIFSSVSPPRFCTYALFPFVRGIRPTHRSLLEPTVLTVIGDLYKSQNILLFNIPNSSFTFPTLDQNIFLSILFLDICDSIKVRYHIFCTYKKQLAELFYVCKSVITFLNCIVPELLEFFSLFHHDPLCNCSRLEVFVAMKICVEVFWVVTPYNDVVEYQCFGGPWCLHLQGEGLGAAWPSETLVSYDITMGCDKPEDRDLNLLLSFPDTLWNIFIL